MIDSLQKKVDNSIYLAYEIVSGKATLYQIESNKYLIQMENGVYKVLDIKNDQL